MVVIILFYLFYFILFLPNVLEAILILETKSVCSLSKRNGHLKDTESVVVNGYQELMGSWELKLSNWHPLLTCNTDILYGIL